MLAALSVVFRLLLKSLVVASRFLPSRKNSPTEGKFFEFVHDRSEKAWQKIMDSAKLSLDQKKPGTKLYWFHVASAGELEQAIPIARGLESAEHCAFLLSYTSPSAKPFLKNFPSLLCSFAHPLFDLQRLRQIHGLLQPEGVFLVRYDLWPSIPAIAGEFQTPVYLLAATQQSVRNGIGHWLSLPLKRKLLSEISHVFAVSKDDAEHYSSLVDSRKVSVAGEPKWARAKERAAAQKESNPGASLSGSPLGGLRSELSRFRSSYQCPIVVFGSPHKDEWKVIDLLLSNNVRPLALIVAPHEVDPATIEKLRSQFNAPSRKVSLLSEFSRKQPCQPPPLDLQDRRVDASFIHHRPRFDQKAPGGLQAQDSQLIVFVDSVGHLAEIYGLGDIAVVGGVFDGALHNCLEPTAHGAATLFGPRHQRAPEASELLAAHAALSFPSPEKMFQFLKQCVRLPSSADEVASQGSSLAQISYNASKLFENIPETHHIIQAHLEATSKTV